MTTPRHLTTLEAILDLKAALVAFTAELANVAGAHRLAVRLRARAARLLNDAAHERGRALRDRQP